MSRFLHDGIARTKFAHDIGAFRIPHRHISLSLKLSIRALSRRRKPPARKPVVQDNHLARYHASILPQHVQKPTL